MDSPLLLNQRQTAHLLGVTPQAVQHWGLKPAGKRGRETLYDFDEAQSVAASKGGRRRRERKSRPPEAHECGQNVLRTAVWMHHELVRMNLPSFLAGWARDEAPQIDLEQLLGGDPERVAAWAAMFIEMALEHLLRDRFDSYFAKQTGFSLDEFNMLVTDTRHPPTSWPDHTPAKPPPEIKRGLRKIEAAGLAANPKE